MEPTSEQPDRRMPEGYTENDYKFFKSFMYINKVGRDVMCEAARALYAKESGTEKGLMPLGDYFKKVLNLSNKKRDKFVTKMHRQYMDENIQTVTFDIPFAHVVMKEACPHLFPVLSETCRNSIERLNKLRDKTCHVYGYLVDIDEVEDIFEKIYGGVSEVIGEKFSDSVKIAKERLRTICSSQVCQIDIDSYFEDVRKFREGLRYQLIEKGRLEIQDSCSQLLIHSPCTSWTQNQDGRTYLQSIKFDIFSSLKAKDTGEEVDLERLFKVTKRCGKKEELPCSLLLHGDAGYGKTTLCHHIIQDWCRGSSSIDGLHDFELVVFVEVRRVRTKHLEDFLRDKVYRETLEDFEPGTVMPTLQNINVLFIIDGYDEARRDSSLPLVNEIFSKFKHSRILLTTRNSHLKDAACIARNFKASSLSIEVCGFDKDRQNLFMTEMIKALNPNSQDCHKEILDLQNCVNGFGRALDSHLKVPITLCLFIYLWRENPTCFSKQLSVAHLYSELSQFCKKRLKDCLDHERTDNIDSILDELQLCLGQQAWNMLVDGNLVCLTEEAHRNVTMECNKRRIDETKFMSSYLCCDTGPEKAACAEKPIFAFLHKSLMEYFAGVYLADAVTKGDCSLLDIDKFVCKASEWSRYQEVVIIFVEHLLQSDSLKGKNAEILKEIAVILKKSDILNADYTFWWNFYLKTHEFEEIRLLISSVLPKNHWQLDANHVVAGLELYQNLRVNLKTLKIDIPSDVDPFSIEGFLTVMKKINEKYKKKKSQSGTEFSPVMVELHFRHHYEHESFTSSEEFLQLLHPWAYLTSFTGKLGQKEVLKYSVKLETVCVRLESIGDVLSFKRSISKYYKSLKGLNIMLCLPFTCSPEKLSDLLYVSELEITMKGIGDQHIEWVEGVLQHIVGRCGCQQLTLLDSTVSYRGISRLQLSLKKIVQEMMTIKLVETPAEEEENQLHELQSKGSIKITWPD